MKYSKLKLVSILLMLSLSSCKTNLLAGNTSDIFVRDSEKNGISSIYDMDIDKDGNLYIADAESNRIKKVTPEGIIENFAGNGNKGDKDGRRQDAELNSPTNIKIDNDRNIYIIDRENEKIKVISDEFIKTLNVNIGRAINSIPMFFDSINQLNLFDGDLYTISKDLEVYTNKNFNDVYGIQIINAYSTKITSDLYIISSMIIRQDPLIFKTYLAIRGNVKNEDVTEKYNKKPYPSSNIMSLTFDNEQNMYFFYENGLITKTSKEGKYIKTYSTIKMRFLYFSFIPFGIEPYYNSNMVIDNKRKILYFNDKSNIYKIDIS